jgi:hypothetical protein
VMLSARHLASLGGLWPLPGAASRWEALLTMLAMRAGEPAAAITNIVLQPGLLACLAAEMAAEMAG